MNRPLTPWRDPRSILFVSPLSPRHLAKAPASGADAIQLDLEDAIVLAEKPAARAALSAAVATLRSNGATSIIVRVNAPWLLAIDDLAAAVEAGVDCVTLPKVESPGRVEAAHDILSELEQRLGRRTATRLLLLIESPRGLENIAASLRASPRVAAVTLGPEDFAKEIGGSPTIAGNEWANAAVLAAGRSAKVTPLGFPGSIAVVEDLTLFRTQVLRAKELGFGGAAVIHPAQVAILNEVFSPSAAELSLARRIVAASQSTAAGAFLLDGRMYDAPHIERARTILLQTDRLGARDAPDADGSS